MDRHTQERISALEKRVLELEARASREQKAPAPRLPVPKRAPKNDGD